jgi:flagellar export protein FliJ
MAFKFTLSTVLRLREIAEEREERLLGQILSQISQNRQTLSELQAKYALLIQRRESELSRQMSAAELQIFYGQMRTVEDLLVKSKEQLVKLEIHRQQQMKVYENAHRNKELLTSMREDQQSIFRREQTRQEQKRMDDNFSARRTIR